MYQHAYHLQKKNPNAKDLTFQIQNSHSFKKPKKTEVLTDYFGLQPILASPSNSLSLLHTKVENGIRDTEWGLKSEEVLTETL